MTAFNGDGGLQVRDFIFGLGGLHRLPFPAQRQRFIREALEIGVRAFDVAPSYGNGLNEVELGIAAGRQRDTVRITTKWGIPTPLYGARCRRAFPVVRSVDKLLNPHYTKRSLVRDFRPEEMVSSLEGSLKRMQTGYVDIYLIHEPLTPIPTECFERLADTAGKLKKEGKIRAWGIAGPLEPLWNSGYYERVDVIQAPLMDLRRAVLPEEKHAVAYSVYRNFVEEGKTGLTFQEFLKNVAARHPSMQFILSTTSISTLRSFKALVA